MTMTKTKTLSVAAIVPLYQRHEKTFPLLHRLLVDSTRRPDEVWLMCEGLDDVDNTAKALSELHELELIELLPPGVDLRYCPTTKPVIPYSNKINEALDLSDADAFVYVDNGSMPSPYKFELMAGALERHPDWGAVYVTQKRTGFQPTVCEATDVVPDAFCFLNFTQVMHRRTESRWPLDLRFADPDIADALFWRSLHAEFGAFHPVGGTEIHDTHHIPSPAANGLLPQLPQEVR